MELLAKEGFNRKLTEGLFIHWEVSIPFWMYNYIKPLTQKGHKDKLKKRSNLGTTTTTIISN